MVCQVRINSVYITAHLPKEIVMRAVQRVLATDAYYEAHDYLAYDVLKEIEKECGELYNGRRVISLGAEQFSHNVLLITVTPHGLVIVTENDKRLFKGIIDEFIAWRLTEVL